MRHIFSLLGALALMSSPSAYAASAVTAQGGVMTETYVAEPMPAGFSIQPSELEGPVFADERGRTLYMWPYRGMRVSTTGDADNVSACLDEVTTKTAGMMSPYPPGMDLPELETRPACTTAWPPVLVKEGAQPVGNFTIITRTDGRKQWAYNKHALYTSYLDSQPGDVFGATTRETRGDGPAEREPVGPASSVPPQFAVITTAKGRIILNDANFSIYTSDRDGPEKSNCDAACARTWVPVTAAATARPQGEWTIFERSPGVRQWAFRKKPVYTYSKDVDTWSLQGGDVPGWHNVYMQVVPPPPKGFSFANSDVGEGLIGPEGKLLYIYYCGDDSKDQLSCDHPGAPQVYRFAVCGGGNVERCLRRWPYVQAASASINSGSRSWSVISINPKTGRHAMAGEAGAMNVWAFRGRPVFTYEDDKEPTDINGNRTGEFNGRRNGFRAFIVRDDFFDAAN
jgi:predicted lipoprotein with Yx(FWY)xxD motif